MLEFRDIKLEDRNEVQTLICASGCHGADYSFANLYIWRKIYKPKVAFMGTRMILDLGRPGFFAYPKGDGDPRPSIEAMREEAHRAGAKLMMRGLTPKTLEELKEYEFWLAAYTQRMEFPYKVHMWQYTDKGTVPGVKGNCDINVYFPDLE